MQEINEKTLREALNAAEGTWQEMPFPEDKIPPGHVVRSIQGDVNETRFLVVEFTIPGQEAAYDGTFAMLPLTFGHLTRALSKEAFLKGTAWLEKQKRAQ